MLCVQTLTHKRSHTVCIVAAHLQLVWYYVHTRAHPHTKPLQVKKGG